MNTAITSSGAGAGIEADIFSLGFGPVMWSRVDRRGTRWQIAALPLGGYVKFHGDADAASGKPADSIDRLPREELRHTMHGAPLWARTAPWRPDRCSISSCRS